jgi:hypothetical protein
MMLMRFPDPSRLRWFVVGALFAFARPLLAQEPGAPWPDPGPPATRDLFPLNLPLLTYRPVAAPTVGKGGWRVSVQVTEENTFEFSDPIKDILAHDTQGRITPTLAGAQQVAQSMPDAPLLFFFDGEVTRTDLSARHGITDSTDVALVLTWQGYGGGFLDTLIEDFHKLGFEQTGRTAIARDQLTFTAIQKGQVIFFTQRALEAKFEDPTIAVIHRFHQDGRWTFSFMGVMKVPLTTEFGRYQSNWDSSLALLAQWRPSARQVVDLGFAYVRRGLKDYTGDPFFIRDQIAGHIGWEWRGWSRVRPFLAIVGQSGLAPPVEGDKLDKPSFIHDLGVHVRLGPRSALTFSYINNITHNENTADMGFALRLTVRP